MKTTILAMFLLSLTTSALAERVIDTVYSISYGENEESHLVFLTNGRVLFYDQNETLPKVGSEIEVDYDESEKVAGPLTYEKSTVLGSYGEANTIFKGMNRSYKNNTECTDRAHVWSYEEWKKRGLISRKVFLFFTNTYIRRYNYHWWFHVSPYTQVQNGNSTTEYVLDRRFTSAPRTMKNWTDIFIFSRKSCPVTTYSYYRSNNNGDEHCFAVKSNMYNRLPLHVRNEENTGRAQTSFRTSEVNFSYRAFYQRMKEIQEH